MKNYQSCKKVQAFKILQIDILEGAGLLLTGEEDTLDVSRAYAAKHQPQVGGYYVRYEGGYESWSPATAFETGYIEL